MALENVNRYFGKPCKNCNTKLKYICNNSCVNCSRKASVKCHKGNGKLAARRAEKKWQQTENGKRSHKNSKLKHLYGITLKEYDERVKLQEGRCSICNEKRKLVIDHNHKTGKFRGLLCSIHNKGLGIFNDDPLLLENAIKYLRGMYGN